MIFFFKLGKRLINPPDNCLFSPRCPFVMKVCSERRPPEFLTAPGHRVACYNPVFHPEE